MTPRVPFIKRAIPIQDDILVNPAGLLQVRPYKHSTAIKGLAVPTPYMFTDLDFIRKQCRLFKRKLPTVKLYYAMKALSDDEVIRAISDNVDGYDAASISEIHKLIINGVDPKTILFSNPVKSSQTIVEAVSLGVDHFAFQSKNELDKLEDSAPGAHVYVRVKMNDSHSGVPLSSKFGCEPWEAVQLLSDAQKRGLTPYGMTFHVGSQATGLDSWIDAINRSADIIRDAEGAGVAISVLNIGGGFPAEYFVTDTTFNEVAEVVGDALAENFSKNKNLTIVAEPGRMIVAESASIVASIIGSELRDGRKWLFTDVGVFQAFIGAARYDHFPYAPYSLRHAFKVNNTNELIPCVVTGPSCDSHDVITEEVWLPEDLELGDKLIFPNTGAYTVTYGSNFNGFDVPPRYFVEGLRR